MTFDPNLVYVRLEEEEEGMYGGNMRLPPSDAHRAYLSAASSSSTGETRDPNIWSSTDVQPTSRTSRDMSHQHEEFLTFVDGVDAAGVRSSHMDHGTIPVLLDHTPSLICC
jgi:hypothetical protein